MGSQIRSVLTLNMQNVPRRFAASLVIVVGVAGTVGVLVSVLAMATGLSRAMFAAGDPARAVVLNDTAAREQGSNIDVASAPLIGDAPGVWHAPDGRPAVSPNVLIVADVNTTSSSNGSRVSMRGVGESVFLVHPEWKIVSGRMFQPGLRELVVGRAVAAETRGLAVGDTVSLGQGQWTVVGEFASGGDIHESEALADVNTVMSAFERNAYNSVSVRLDSPESLSAFASALGSNPAIKVKPYRETDYYRRQAEQAPRLLFIVSNLIGGIMALGAMFTALNTMYAAVAARRIEIATLRAIGFGSASVVTSVLAEALLLSIVGAVLGAGVAWLLFNGDTASMTGSGFQSRLVFKLRVEPQVVAIGMLWACAIGLLGGLLPAIRAARMPVAHALRPA